ncbi:IQ and ubiquitin-like domain-containing protein [Anopheles albimanus]|uniref:IQ motif and ubiquitin-like domain-containing protein n=1 Tax=Anopheles albimanus TaxID=7167 RepID=A0A182F971_ANOAL|nr:IQ and ubiquitin-like domain-containing protein [Anopheles albimanus]
MDSGAADDEESFSVSGFTASGGRIPAVPGSLSTTTVSEQRPRQPAVASRKDVTVKFHLAKAQVVAHAYPGHYMVDEVREHIACKFQVKSKFLLLRQAGAEVAAHRRLADLAVSEYNVCDLELLLTDAARQENVQLNVKLYYKNLTLPDIITVRIPGEDGKPSRDVVVEIENQVITKPFVGGYINRQTKVEYHHAFSQTGPPSERIGRPGAKLSRDTQTVCERHTTTAIPRDQSVQFSSVEETAARTVTADGCKVPTGPCLIPNRYEPYQELAKRKDIDGKVRLIQRNFRRLLRQRLIRKSAAEWRQLQQRHLENEAAAKISRAAANNKTLIARTFPKTKEEFDALFAQIHCWKENELKLIRERYSGAPKIAEMNILLDKEIQLLNGVERQRRAIQRELTDVVVEKRLTKISEPKRWVGCNNRVIEMETPQTQRARFLLGYYQRLKEAPQPTAATADPQERIGLLDELSDVIVQECHPATEELESLLQRERQLLLCRMDPNDLSPLRKRQLALLAEIIRSEPGKAREKTARKLCRKCKKLRPTNAFTVHTRQKSADICETCTSLLGSTVDIAVYRSILRAVRRDERKRGSLASYAFIIQENDIKHIVERIWHGHSVISNDSDRADLMLPRWNVAQDWSPWNCVCLTEQETRAHLKLQRLDRYYQPSVMKEIQSKHSLARSVFSQLREIDQEFTESGDWWEVGLDGNII